MAEKMKSQGSGERRPPSEFPRYTLQNALKVATALEDKNGGNPLPPMEVAFAIDMSPGSSSFRDLLSSSIKYGLTAGSFNQSKVSLEGLGRDIVEPKSPTEKTRAMIEAALRPEPFRRVYEYYKGKKMPEPQFFANTVNRDFGIARELADRFIEVFSANMAFLGLVKEGPTGRWLSAELRSEVVAGSERVESEYEQESGSAIPIDQPPQKPPMPAREIAPAARNAIFVGHGKNKIPLQQLEKILTEYRLPYKVAVEEPNKGRPISQKVAEIMHECGAAIIIFTADEELKDVDGKTIYRPTENAIFELGAASALYGSRIIIFRDSKVEFPTNFRDIGYITFEENNLSAKVNELFRELIGFGLIKISVASA